MFALVFERDGAPARRKVFGRERDLTIGSADDNDIVLDDPKVAPQHAIVVVEKDRLSIYATSGNVVLVD